MIVDLRGLARNIKKAMGRKDGYGWGYTLDCLIERHEQLEAVLADLLTNEPCSLDHHGFCQTHYCHPPCPHERAKKLLSK